jgi:hypothetical protein
MCIVIFTSKFIFPFILSFVFDFLFHCHVHVHIHIHLRLHPRVHRYAHVCFHVNVHLLVILVVMTWFKRCRCACFVFSDGSALFLSMAHCRSLPSKKKSGLSTICVTAGGADFRGREKTCRNK